MSQNEVFLLIPSTKLLNEKVLPEETIQIRALQIIMDLMVLLYVVMVETVVFL